MTDPGHVFVYRGDVTSVACDAWLLPTDRELRVEPTWSQSAGASRRASGRSTSGFIDVDSPAGWGTDVRSFHVPEWSDADSPQTWFTEVGGSPGTPIDWYVSAVVEFARRASTALREGGTPPRYGRDRHLLATHVVGGGEGGSGKRKGDLLGALLPAMEQVADKTGVDLALVAFSHSDLVAAKAARQRNEPATRWAALTDVERRRSDLLGDEAAHGRLVMFLGAGISAGAGLPLWQGLLDALADDVGLAEEERNELHALDARDQAHLLRLRMEQRSQDFGDAVTRRTTASGYAQTHALLANLPVREVVTLNYDDLFERAAADAGQPAARIPEQEPEPGGRWLLKLHGSVEDPTSVVLTRRDYLEYGYGRSALLGVVQAMLLTRHMLFIGFSLSDEHFHRIMHEVQQAVGANRAERRLGTALLLHRQSLLLELWGDTLDCVELSNDAAPTAAAARRLEIFLDRVLLKATSSVGHLLDATHDGLLLPHEEQLRDLLIDLQANASAELRSSLAWEEVTRTLQRFGAEPVRHSTESRSEEPSRDGG